MFFKTDDGKPGPKKRSVPLLPLRDIIVFPHMVSQLFVGRERSINALDALRWHVTRTSSSRRRRTRRRTSPRPTISSRSARSARSCSCFAFPMAP